MDSDTGLILDVTAVDAASPAYSIDMGRDGTIRYAFQVKVPRWYRDRERHLDGVRCARL